MRVLIHSRTVPMDEELRAYIERRLYLTLGRFAPLIRRVRLHLSDVRGGPGHSDRYCRAIVRLRPSGKIVIGDSDRNAHVAVARVADRLARVMSREMERRREDLRPVDWSWVSAG